MGVYMHSKQGFSLVELLVVVAIIATLAGMTLPTYQINTTKVRVTDVVRVLESLSKNLMVYYNTKGVMPATLEGIAGGDAGVFEVSQLTSYLHYDNGSTWTNSGALVQLDISDKIGKAIPGYIASTDGTDGVNNSIVMAFYEKDGTMMIYCGRLDTTSSKYLPLEYLPAGCDNENFLHTVTGN